MTMGGCNDTHVFTAHHNAAIPYKKHNHKNTRDNENSRKKENKQKRQ